MFRSHKRKARAGQLYNAIVAQARRPEFYATGFVPDTIEGRYEMVVLHCHLVLRRLGRAGAEGAKLAQDLFDYMGSDFDRSMREIGVGDVSVGKYMKRLGMGFYGRAGAYDAALDGDDNNALAAALSRNVLGSAEDDPALLDEAAACLALYVRESDRILSACSVAALAEAQPRFAHFQMRKAA